MKINKENFNQEFKFIQNLFINNDPGGLIDGGAPHDEYDSYIHQLISGFKSFQNESDIYNYIKRVFDGFGYFDESNGKIISEKIWKRYFIE